MYGIVASVRLRRQSKETVMSVKHRPDDIQNFDNKLFPKEQYALKYSLPHHATVTEHVITSLVQSGHVSAGYFN